MNGAISNRWAINHSNLSVLEGLATLIGSHLTREPTASPVLTKWSNWELMLATNFGNICRDCPRQRYWDILPYFSKKSHCYCETTNFYHWNLIRICAILELVWNSPIVLQVQAYPCICPEVTKILATKFGFVLDWLVTRQNSTQSVGNMPPLPLRHFTPTRSPYNAKKPQTWPVSVKWAP